MNNEKGLTLIEVLAVIVIMAIVSSLLFGVFSNIQKNYKLQNQKNQLAQEANIVLTTIKMNHQKGINYDIQYNTSTKKIYIGSEKIDLLSSPYTAEIIQLQQDEAVPFNGNTINIDPSLPLFIQIKISNSYGQSTMLDTIISNYQGG